MDSLTRFEETKLPSKKAFSSRLNLKGINKKDLCMHRNFRITWKKDIKLISQHLLENRSFTVRKRIWDLSKYSPKTELHSVPVLAW